MTGIAHPGELHRSVEPVWRWRRSLAPKLVAYVSWLLDGPWFNFRFEVELDKVANAVERGFDQAGIEHRRAQSLLARDIASLAGLYADVAGPGRVEVRVEHDPTAHCPAFHQDNNVLRLLTTYAGPGTEWLPEDRLDRRELGLQGRAAAAANEAIALGAPERAEPGEVLIGKGLKYGRGHGTFVHRSPSINLGDRLLVAIDLAD